MASFPSTGDDPGGSNGIKTTLDTLTDPLEEGTAEIEIQGRVKSYFRATYRLPKGNAPFNLLKAHKDLLKTLYEADKTLKFKCNDKDNIIAVIDEEFPKTEDEFKAAFDVVTGETLPNIGKSVSVSHVLFTNYRIGNIKNNTSNNVMDYLKKNRISIQADSHHSQHRASVGSLLKVHPRMFYRQDVHRDIYNALTRVKLSPENTTELNDANITRWFHVKVTEEDMNLSEDSDEEVNCEIDWTQPPKIPHFEVIPRAAYAGMKQTKVQTDLLEIQCNRRDAPFLSLLMATAAATNLFPYGEFLPRGGIHSDEAKSQLRRAYINQNRYLDQCKAVYVNGLKEGILHEITLEHQVTMHDYLMETGVIQAIQRTNETKSKGKHVFITTQDKVNIVRNLIDMKLRSAFEIVPAQPRITSPWTPSRTNIS